MLLYTRHHIFTFGTVIRQYENYFKFLPSECQEFCTLMKIRRKFCVDISDEWKFSVLVLACLWPDLLVL